MADTPLSKEAQLREHVWGIINVLQALFWGLVASPKRNKRILKISLSLTMAVAFTLPPIFSDFHGANPFLLGTVAIYMFPVKTIGGQLVATAIGLIGVLIALGYSNLVLFLAALIQDDDDENIVFGRRVFLWLSFVLISSFCGYIRSKFPRLYLGTVLGMVVNMFAIIRGVNTFGQTFRNFFYVMVFGACVSMVVGFVFWPEDHSSILRDDMIDGVKAAQSMMESVRWALRQDSGQEIDITSLKNAHSKIHASLREAGYEISVSRIPSSEFVPFDVALAKLVSAARIFNSAMRRRNRLYPNLRRRFEDLFPPATIHSTRTSSVTVVTRGENMSAAKETVDDTFVSTSEIFDSMAQRIEEMFRGREVTSVIDHEKYWAKVNEIPEKWDAESSQRSVSSTRELEEAAYRDQVNTILLEMFDIVTDIAVIVEEDSATEEGGEASQDTIDPDEDEDLMLREATTRLDRFGIFLSDLLCSLRNSRHIKYGIKFAVVMGLLSLPAFIQRWYIWYEDLRVQWALISAMVAMETTRGMTFRTAGMKLLGALMGGFSAWAVMSIGLGHYYSSICLTPIIGLIVGCLVTNPKYMKAGTVFALAYNIILGVATVFPSHGNVSAAFARRILTLPVGVVVAMAVHLMLFPFKSRSHLVKGISHSLDWLHHLLFAIEASSQYPSLQEKFDDMAKKASSRVNFAKLLLPATVYEVSLSGHWPYERFERILEKVEDVMILVIGENDGIPVMARSGTCEGLRLKLLASLCNDLLVISHTLSARLFMPRNQSLSSSVLSEYQTFLSAKIVAEEVVIKRNFSDLGRLSDLVNEMNLLREDVDELITETQCPKRGLLPQLSFIIKKSRPATAVASMVDVEGQAFEEPPVLAVPYNDVRPPSRAYSLPPNMP
ncbi:uncharacterized protein LAJ45_09595 [Morchella importuna]|uniref:uncharacterized protein n=1 Tax=Morchella importuna TaxID=1174673 RepID=UPI001E8E0305|nr:uncharacterized protein LAJ45_09595 [Morchella importuna]KAH8146402.1 hypothetical protein LAJ45_09595 [Morchella importuna]